MQVFSKKNQNAPPTHFKRVLGTLKQKKMKQNPSHGLPKLSHPKEGSADFEMFSAYCAVVSIPKATLFIL